MTEGHKSYKVKHSLIKKDDLTMQRYTLRIITFFTLIILFAGPAYAWPWDGWFGSKENTSEKLNDINTKTDEIANNTKLMKFIYSNMVDQGVEVVEISIKNDTKILKTYYIIRDDKKKGTASITEIAPKNTGVVWKFRPFADQALDGLDMAANDLMILEQSDISKFTILTKGVKGLNLYYSIESENVPKLSVLVNNSNCRRCKKVLSWIGI